MRTTLWPLRRAARMLAPLSLLLLLVLVSACGEETEVENTAVVDADSALTDDLTTTTGQSIVDLITSDARFSTLATALDSAGLVTTLQGAGPFTVFAPTNDAFDALPQGTLNTLLVPENRDRLRDVLLYHVHEGALQAGAVTTMASVETLQGGTVPVMAQNGEVMLGNATVVEPDVQASNGVVHVLDGVLLPAEDAGL